jgi:DeoR family transcriptional regulator of aga operon
MDRYSRLNALLDLVNSRGRLDVATASAELGVSAATIRRDLAHLSGERLATRTRGGVVANTVGYDLPLKFKTGQHADDKKSIAARAAELARPGEVVSLNGGTTTLETGRALAARQDFQIADPVEPALTVITNAVNIANELLVWPFLKVVVSGGVVRSRSYELFGPMAIRFLDDLSIDTAFVGVNGIDPVFGASAFDDSEAQMNGEMAHRADRVIVVADSSKVGVRALARICPITDVDILVTDSGLSADLRQQFIAAGVEVVVAD